MRLDPGWFDGRLKAGRPGAAEFCAYSLGSDETRGRNRASQGSGSLTGPRKRPANPTHSALAFQALRV